jgi:hypothetical protein
VPNVGHDLGDKKQAMAALSAFFGATITKRPYTECDPQLTYGKKGITLRVTATPDVLVDAIIWSTNSTDTDFRDERWEGRSLGLKKKSSVITLSQPYASNGYRAFYLELKYKDPNGGEYMKSTRMYVADEDEVFVR